ncbi:MAG: PepSY-associated TM helix domain-containing protein [Methylococcaceae bacterium]|nr:PepSY-associated TM helix domain-containing protein [Methylococcaceae bacterium]
MNIDHSSGRVSWSAKRLLGRFSGAEMQRQANRDASHHASLLARRKCWLKVHLYLGLWLGAILVVIGLTGSVLVFWQEIDAWLNPDLAQVEAPAAGAAAYRPLDEIVSAAQAAMPPGAKSSYIYYPRHPGLAFWFFYDGPKDAADKSDTLNVFVDPYTAQVIGTRIWYHAYNPLRHCFMGFMFKLHYALLLGYVGAALVGFLGVFMLVSVLTGLILWWPLTGKWRQALTFKPRASQERFNYDLHKTFGFYFLLVFVAVFVSGVSFNLPDQFRWLVERFSPVVKAQPLPSKPALGRPPLSANAALERVRQYFPDQRLYWFSVPTTAQGSYEFTLQQPAARIFTGRHQLALDQYSGEILGEFSPTSGSGGQMFMQWQWSLHSGHALGMPGRLLVLASGLACLLLYVTGLIRWLQKRQAAHKKQSIRTSFEARSI